MRILNTTSASATGNWFYTPGGVYEIAVYISGTGTVTLQRAMDATPGTTTGTSLGSLVDSSGTTLSITASTGARYGQTLGAGYVRATLSGGSGTVIVDLSPVSIETAKTGLESQ